MSCNYATGGNYVGAIIYEAGSLASGCTSGENDGLCIIGDAEETMEDENKTGDSESQSSQGNNSNSGSEPEETESSESADGESTGSEPGEEDGVGSEPAQPESSESADEESTGSEPGEEDGVGSEPADEEGTGSESGGGKVFHECIAIVVILSISNLNMISTI